MYALGLIETVGYTTAVSAADVALKAAEVELIAIERVIGAGGSLGVTIQLSGDVAAVTSAVEAGKKEAERVGKLISAHVIPRAHSEVDQKLLTKFKQLDNKVDFISGSEQEKQMSLKKEKGGKQEIIKTADEKSASKRAGSTRKAVANDSSNTNENSSSTNEVNEG